MRAAAERVIVSRRETSMEKTQEPYKEESPSGPRSSSGPDRARRPARTWWYITRRPATACVRGFGREVASVGFYHGVVELYQLEGIPGTWHET